MDHLASCCRLCRTPNATGQPWNHLFAVHHHQLVKQIRACTGVQIADNDPLPKWICDQCLTALDQAYCFRIQCRETDAAWHSELILRQTEPAPPPLPVALVYVKPEVEEITTEEARIVKEEPVSEPETDVEQPAAETCQSERRTKDSSWNKRFRCRYCPKDFGRKCRLRVHEKRHSLERSVQCGHCESKFFTESDMRVHAERMHAGAELPHGCDKCGKRFYSKGQLQNHSVTHAEVREFTCDICAKSFKTKYYLKHHVSLHRPNEQKRRRGKVEPESGLANDAELRSENDEPMLQDIKVEEEPVKSPSEFTSDRCT